MKLENSLHKRGYWKKIKQTWGITPNFPFTQCKTPASFPSHSVTGCPLQEALTHSPACQHPIILHAAPHLFAEWSLPSGYATSPSASVYPPEKGRFLRVGIGWLSTHRVPSTQESGCTELCQLHDGQMKNSLHRPLLVEGCCRYIAQRQTWGSRGALHPWTRGEPSKAISGLEVRLTLLHRTSTSKRTPKDSYLKRRTGSSLLSFFSIFDFGTSSARWY